MPVRECPPRPALQIPLESSRLLPPPKRKVGLHHPRHKLGSMPNPAPVMLPQPRHQIPSHPRVPLPRKRLTPQQINIKQGQPPLPKEANPPQKQPGQPPSHQQINQSKGQPAEPQRPIKRPASRTPKGNQKACQPKPEGRRLVEAAGVEPASEMARCDMTTCVSGSESRRNANEPARSVPSSLIDLEPRPQTVACALSHKMTLTRQRMGSSPRAAT